MRRRPDRGAHDEFVWHRHVTAFAVVGSGHSELAELHTPPIAVVAWDQADVGRIAAGMLLDQAPCCVGLLVSTYPLPRRIEALAAGDQGDAPVTDIQQMARRKPDQHVLEKAWWARQSARVLTFRHIL